MRRPNRIPLSAPLAAALLAALLGGCGGGSPTETLPNLSGSETSSYTGPPPATEDVQAFKLNVWDNLSATNRCGGCHGGGGQAPTDFVDLEDVNAAYTAANSIVDLRSPSESLMVTKVGNGHNCWTDSPSACADIIATYISRWAEASGGVSARSIELTEPPEETLDGSRQLPADSGLFASTVHPLLKDHCAGCHTESATVPQAPYFAEADADRAYEQVKSKIDLDTPENSRLHVRLASEFHNCWSDCSADAAAMLAQIQAMADQVTPTEVDPTLVTSKPLSFVNGIVASGGNRHEANQIALWEFKTGSGSTAYDTSGIEPAIDLTLSGDYSWVGAYGISFVDGKAQGSTTASSKLHDLIRATGEYSIEAWVTPANVTQEGPARIISYSAGTTARNFTLGQTLYNYDFMNRSSVTDGNGEPMLSTADDDEDLQATLQHVVATYDPINGRRIYVNGVFTGDTDPEGGGDLNDWDDSFAFMLGNEAGNDRPWAGTLRLVAIHNRALSEAQIRQNLEAGVGKKLYMLFGISHLIDVPKAYILFEVSQFDDYSYLFYRPTFVTLEPGASIGSIPLKGIRIGINGKEAEAGQAFVNIDTTLSDAAYGDNGQVLSELGSIIAVDRGPDSDKFFLTFERLGSHAKDYSDPGTYSAPTPTDLPAAPDIGLRLFDEINLTMSELTGVAATESGVAATYATIRQQLPSLENMDGFLSAHQMAIAQLAMEYCNALLDDAALRAAFFPGFDFSQSQDVAFDTQAELDLVTGPLTSRFLGENLATQPAPTDVAGELETLIASLAATCTDDCGSARTLKVVKGACAATLGSAVMLLQ